VFSKLHSCRRPPRFFTLPGVDDKFVRIQPLSCLFFHFSRSAQRSSNAPDCRDW
jgi:hypothetical protein